MWHTFLLLLLLLLTAPSQYFLPWVPLPNTWRPIQSRQCDALSERQPARIRTRIASEAGKGEESTFLISNSDWGLISSSSFSVCMEIQQSKRTSGQMTKPVINYLKISVATCNYSTMCCHWLNRAIVRE
ncbi:hypothetical protein V8F33_007626 [Rhypophila sp. PSN 637]